MPPSHISSKGWSFSKKPRGGALLVILGNIERDKGKADSFSLFGEKEYRRY